MRILPTKLTKAFIRSLTYEDTSFLVRDTTIKGLMIAVNKHSKSYKVQRDLWVGERGRRRQAKTVRRTLRTTDELTLRMTCPTFLYHFVRLTAPMVVRSAFLDHLQG